MSMKRSEIRRTACMLAKFRKSAYCLFSYNSVEYKMIYKFCFAIKNINYKKRGVSHSL